MALLPLLLLLAGPRLAAAAEAAGCAAGAGSCAASSPGREAAARLAEQDRALHLLQQRGAASAAAGAPLPPLKAVNLALEGGGAASTTLFSGGLAALMHVLAEEKGQDPASATFQSTGLFRSVPNLTSVSGGSWLAAGLIYSPYYLKTVELIAQQPARDAAIWNERWTQPLLGKPAGILGADLVKIIETCILGAVLPPALAKLFLPTVAELVKNFVGGATRTILEDLILFSYYFASEAKLHPGEAPVQYSWQAYVDEFLLRTARIGPEVTLGNAPNAFFRGKEWIPVVSQLNPARGDWSAQTYVRSVLWSSYKEFFDYQMQQAPGDEPACPWLVKSLCECMDKKMPQVAQTLFGPHYVTPARFSITTGQGKYAKAPLPWCDGASCEGRRVQYKLVQQWKPWWWRGQAVELARLASEAPQTEGEVSRMAFDMAAGKLPVSAVTAASSAAAGIAALLSPIGLPPACALSGGGVAASNAGKGESFQEAGDFLEEEKNNIQSGGKFTAQDFQEATKMAIQLVGDGGFTDNTGAMTAIGEGASTVAILMAINVSYVDMFTPNSGFSDFSAYHVFTQRQNEAWATLAAGTSLLLPRDDFKHVFGIRFGNQLVTTADNKDAQAFGIPPNKEVLLEWLWFDTNIGLFEPLFSGSQDPLTALTEEYNTAIAEVVEIMLYPPNRPHMRELLQGLGAL